MSAVPQMQSNAMSPAMMPMMGNMMPMSMMPMMNGMMPMMNGMMPMQMAMMCQMKCEMTPKGMVCTMSPMEGMSMDMFREACQRMMPMMMARCPA